MKRFQLLLTGAFFSFAIVTSAFAVPPDRSTEGLEIAKLEASAARAVSEAQWAVFSQNLVGALQSAHNGLQQAAMRLVIRHGDNVEVTDAVFDVMKLYRNSADVNLKRMAVVTLGRMNSDWAIQFLVRSERFEKSDLVRKTIRAVVNQQV